MEDAPAAQHEDLFCEIPPHEHFVQKSVEPSVSTCPCGLENMSGPERKTLRHIKVAVWNVAVRTMWPARPSGPLEHIDCQCVRPRAESFATEPLHKFKELPRHILKIMDWNK